MTKQTENLNLKIAKEQLVRKVCKSFTIECLKAKVLGVSARTLRDYKKKYKIN